MSKITVFILILITNSLAHAQTAGNSQPPNILVILGCQHSGWAMSCAEADYFETPHLDRLANDGVLFTNAYTTHPVCMPGRVSMMTGRMPSEVGMNYNGAIDTVMTAPTLGELMKNSGYETAWIGKSHLPPLANQRLETFLTFDHI
ncbi:MAG: sulfatase-like hydrolase/transferase [Balneolaceae bacterium]|nr:sulfatase-like hydrolase/transferase [Balneolaceae bacterium]